MHATTLSSVVLELRLDLGETETADLVQVEKVLVEASTLF